MNMSGIGGYAHTTAGYLARCAECGGDVRSIECDFSTNRSRIVPCGHPATITSDLIEEYGP